MKSTTELRSLFDSELKSALRPLEIERKKLRNQYIVFGLGITISIVLAVVFFRFNRPFWGSAIGLISTVTFFILIQLTNTKREKYRKLYKESVVRVILQIINPEWQYRPDYCVARENYFHSQLFDTPLNRYSGDDLVYGSLEETGFQMSELHTEYEVETSDSNGNTSKEWRTIFKGLFAFADFNKEIKGKTIVVPDTGENLLSYFGLEFQALCSQGEIVKLENVEFEKYFKVFGSDQIEARYVLTPIMMESLVKIRKKYNRYVYFSFIGSRVYMAIYYKKDMFEPRIFKSGIRFNDMLQMNEQFGAIETLIRELNLNTRIWTKPNPT